MKRASIEPLHYAPWGVLTLCLVSATVWLIYRRPDPAASRELVEAAYLVGRCQDLVEQSAQAINTQAADSLGIALTALHRLRTDVSRNAGVWRPTAQLNKLLDELETQLRATQTAGKKQDPAPLVDAVAQLRLDVQKSTAALAQAPPTLLWLSPADWLFASTLLLALLAMGLWRAATYREPIDFLELERRNLVALATNHSAQALQRCHELSQRFLETAQQVLELRQANPIKTPAMIESKE